MQQFYSGFGAIIGRTNVGKSTLLNVLAGEKVAITTNKPQTTRNAIKAIINRPNSQIIFIDTPGIHKPKTKLGETLNETAFETLKQVDFVLFLIEANSKEIGPGDKKILEKLRETNKNVILVINKIDLIKTSDLLELIDKYQREYDFIAIIPISAIQNEGIEELIKEIEKILPQGPAYYDKEEYTDQTMRQLVEETIREKALNLLQEEVPHGIYIEIEKMKKRKTKENEPIYDIEATIYCVRNSHKGIIIGKNGSMLKKIGIYAREEIEKMIETKVNLKLWVKVQENWQNEDRIIKRFKLK